MTTNKVLDLGQLGGKSNYGGNFELDAQKDSD